MSLSTLNPSRAHHHHQQNSSSQSIDIRQQSLTINTHISKLPHPMSPRTVLPSPPRTPLGNLDVQGNTKYLPIPSSLYATAKTSRSKSIDAKSIDPVSPCHNISGSDSDSADTSMENASNSPSNSAESMLPQTASPVTGALPSEVDDDFATLTPTPKLGTGPRTPRKATPPALFLHESLFVTPPKATTHYPHVLEPITERASVASLRTPPTRVPTPLTHPIFKMAKSVRSRHISAAPSCLRDRFLLSATTTSTGCDSRPHATRLPHEAVTPSRERCTNAPLSAARLKAVGRISDRHYHPWDILARRQPRQQKTTAREKGTVATAIAGMRMRAGRNQRHSDAGRKTRAERAGGARVTAKDKLGAKARLGPKRKINRGWDKLRGKMAWVCCGRGYSANSMQWEEVTGRGP